MVAYCSYLWGYFSLLVAIILGPLLIPWVLIPQLQFLAWGWFRTLLGAGVHMMVAGACFAVVAQILMIPIIRFSTLVTLANSQPVVEAISVHPLGLLAGTAGVALSAGLAAITESLPLILVAYLGAFKIGEITAMIMNGGSMPGSGISDRMRSMRSMSSTGRSLGMIGGRGAATAAGAAAAGVGAAAAGVATGGSAAVAAVAAGKVLHPLSGDNSRGGAAPGRSAQLLPGSGHPAQRGLDLRGLVRRPGDCPDWLRDAGCTTRKLGICRWGIERALIDRLLG